MSYGPIPGYNKKEEKCRYCVDISLKVAGITALSVIILINILGAAYGIKMYNQVTPILSLITDNITEVFNQGSRDILMYGNKITQDINNVTSEFNVFSKTGLNYIRLMTEDLNKIVSRIG